MAPLPLALLILVLSVFGYGIYYYNSNKLPELPLPALEPSFEAAPGVVAQRVPSVSVPSNDTSRNFQCDGRSHCSEMTSCAEARFFLNNCPNTKMDGDGDGIPCEDQWCGH